MLNTGNPCWKNVNVGWDHFTETNRTISHLTGAILVIVDCCDSSVELLIHFLR